MSSLLFYMDEHEATVVTDTLIVTPDEVFLGHANKAVSVDELRLITAGTGAADLFIHWISFVNEESAASDVDSLNDQATERLQAIWREMQRQLPALSDQTATIYLFGISNNTGFVHSYVYRSTSNFESSRLAHGLAMRPAVTAEDLGGVEYWNFPASGKEIMRVQAALEHAKPKGQRVLIGGVASVLKLTKDGIEFLSLGPLDIATPL
ncbi:hypothetical protein [Pseudomonas sp. RL_105y_Pfl2_101]|uniref:hypothetical protein n=1 Tax=Pseudomonas sp. RL_105y_Pfl2_101 TaxID=3088708 RepID=UPI0030DCBF34